MSIETARELVPVTPPAAVAGLTWAGIQLSDFVLILTAIYTLVQLIITLPKLFRLIREWYDKARK